MAHIKLSRHQIVKDLFETGLTRYKTDRNYNPEIGSIQEKYKLTIAQTRQVFQDSKLAQMLIDEKNKISFVEDETTSAPEQNVTIPDAEPVQQEVSDEIIEEMISETVDSATTVNEITENTNTDESNTVFEATTSESETLSGIL